MLAYIVLGKSGAVKEGERLVKVDNVEFDQVTPNQQSGKKLTVRSDNPLQRKNCCIFNFKKKVKTITVK